MALKRTLDSLDGVDDAIKPLYTEKDGKFHLQLEDDGTAAELADVKAKLGEFRTRNNSMQEQLDALKGEKDAATQTADEATGKAKSMAERLAALEEAHEATTAEAEAAKASARKTTLVNKLTEAGIAAGVDRQAVPRFAQVHVDSLDLDDSGNIIVKGENGPRISKAPETAGEPMTPKEYAGLVLQDEPFWAAPSTGDGAGGDGGGGGGGSKTISRDEFKNADADTMDKVAKGEIAVAVE